MSLALHTIPLHWPLCLPSQRSGSSFSESFGSGPQETGHTHVTRTRTRRDRRAVSGDLNGSGWVRKRLMLWIVRVLRLVQSKLCHFLFWKWVPFIIQCILTPVKSFWCRPFSSSWIEWTVQHLGEISAVFSGGSFWELEQNTLWVSFKTLRKNNLQIWLAGHVRAS